jgi:PAS domain S-box-containing protein
MVKPTGDGPSAASRAAPAPATRPPSQHAVIEMTGIGVVSGWNPAATLLYSYAAEEIVGHSADVLCPPAGRAAEAPVRRRIIAGGRPEQYEADRVRKDGTRIRVSLTAGPVTGPAGAIVGVTATSWRISLQQGTGVTAVAGTDASRREDREVLELSEVTDDASRREDREVLERSDVTDDASRRHDREVLERKERLQAQAQRLESLGQLAGGVAHDFNNLLAVILNYVSFVSEEVAAAAAMAGPGPADHLEAASADLVEIKKAAERAAGLTHQLLVFARRDVIRPQVLDLDTVITAIEEMLRRTIGEHVELVTSLAGDLWPVLADPGQLDQVLVNLAVNARDAMPAGGTLTIDTSNTIVDADAIAGGSQARAGRNVRLRVSDNGSGMPAEVAQHAFEPFFTTKPDGGGTGLGLATVYGILAQADGNIWIYSESGAGTTFTITLPATAESVAPVAEPMPYRRTPKGETVLVVEDEVALREVTRRIFTRNGYQVITAASGPEALGIAAGHPGEIHLLVTDVVMPHMLGKEVAEKMRLIRPEIEVVFMSGYARPVLASQGRLDPGVALVEKPFSEADLLTVAGQVLNGHFQGFTTIQGTTA